MSERKKIKDTAAKYFSKYIRIKECLETTGTKEHGLCCTCGKIKEFSKLDAGHFVPGRHDSILFDERNCHIQCIKCNRFEQGAWDRYYMYMLRKYGLETINELLQNKLLGRKYATYELKQIKEYYKNLLKGIQ